MWCSAEVEVMYIFILPLTTRTMQIENAKGSETFLDFLLVAEETFEDEGGGGNAAAAEEE